MKDRLRYKEGTVNGVKFINKDGTNKSTSTKTLIKIGFICLIVLIVFFVFYLIVKKMVSFNGVYYETPSDDEVVEVVVDPEEENPQEQVNLKLKGKLVVELEQGKEWKDPGFIATSDIKGDISEYVKVTGKVDTETVGTYEIVYELEYKVIAPKLTRLVKVIEEKDDDGGSSSGGDSDSGGSSSGSGGSSSSGGGSSSSGGGSSTPAPPVAKPSTINLSLIGNETIYLITGETYTEQGASAVDNLGNNVSSNITKSGSVNTSAPGTYKITYSITNYNGQVLSVVRNVVVQAMNINLSSRVNGSNVDINVVTNVDNFWYIRLPNGSKSTSQSYTYTVAKNGTYEFIVYNSNGGSRKATITINNVPAYNPPRVSCSISNASGKSVITITASSSVGISYYTYSGSKYTTNRISLQRKIPSGSTVIVSAVDNNGVSNTASCTSP